MLKSNFKVLIAEDDTTLLKYLTEYFTKRGIKILSATSGQEALDICIKETVPFIISDWNMPNMSGIELLEIVRNIDDHYREVPFIFITSLREKDQVVRATKVNVDDYLIKPFRVSLLEERFEKVLIKRLLPEYIALCFAEIEKYNYKHALMKLYNCFQEDPNNFELNCCLVICHSELGEHQTAAKIFKNMPFDNSSGLFMYAFGLVNIAQQDASQAQEHFSEAIRLEPEFVKAYIKLSELYISKGMHEQALDVVNSIDDSKVKFIPDVEGILKIYQNLDAKYDCVKKIAIYNQLQEKLK